MNRYRPLFAASVAALALASVIACSSGSDTSDNNSPNLAAQSAVTPTGCVVNGTPYFVIDNELWTFSYPSTMAYTIAPAGDVPNALWSVSQTGVPAQTPVMVDGGVGVGPLPVAAPAACIADPIDPATYDPSCGHISTHPTLHTCATTHGQLPCIVASGNTTEAGITEGPTQVPLSVDGSPGRTDSGALVSNETGEFQNTCQWPTSGFGQPFEVAYTTANGFLVECNAGPCVGAAPPAPPPPPVINVPTFPNPNGDTCLIGQTQYERLSIFGHEFLFEVVNNGSGIQPVELPVTYVDGSGNQFVVINGAVYQLNADGTQTEVSYSPNLSSPWNDPAHTGQPVPPAFVYGDTPTFEGLQLASDGIPLVCEPSCAVNAKINPINHHILTPSGYGYHFEDTGVTLDGSWQTRGNNTGITNPNRIGVQSCNYDQWGNVTSCAINMLVVDGQLYLEDSGQGLISTGRSDRFCCSDADGYYGDNNHNHVPDGFQP